MHQRNWALLTEIDQTRLSVSAGLDAQSKSQFGQFMTPGSVARFMASLFSDFGGSECRFLDPGAGIGSLSAAFLERWLDGELAFSSATLTACELDASLRAHLIRTLLSYQARSCLKYEIVARDFIEEAVNRLQFGGNARFTHAILNPPYKKINSNSRHRLLLRQVGIETVNLYSAFVALALAMLAPRGQLVAILPRSFCNGPYYRPFREFVLKHSAIRHMHLFTSRKMAFKDDDVLQENVIVLIERSDSQRGVTVSTSTDGSFDDYKMHVHPFDEIVCPGDSERFIHMPASPEFKSIELFPELRYTLDDIRISVSTGPVVDFRLKEHLRAMPEPGCVPLLYAGHFTRQKAAWPKEGIKKPNAIHRNAITEKWLYPNGFYTVVRRFSSKEEKRRICASVVEPKVFPDTEMLGFENHLNVFHERKKGLPETLAHGLTAFLNTTPVEDYFRRFNGHTQVNATDLRMFKYPSREGLIALGAWAMQHKMVTQDMLDDQLTALRG